MLNGLEGPTSLQGVILHNEYEMKPRSVNPARELSDKLYLEWLNLG